MKKQFGKAIGVVLLLLATILLATILSQPTDAVPLDTYHSSWHLVRETANEDADTKALVYNLTLAGNFANKNSASVASGGPFQIPSRYTEHGFHEGYSAGGAWMFAICGENFDDVDDTFHFNIYGWSKTNGMLQNIVEGDGVLGTQAVIMYPDSGDAVGALVSETGVSYANTNHVYTVTNEGFNGAVVGMMAYVTSADANLTSGYYKITTVAADSNSIRMSGDGSSGDVSSVSVQINPAFWTDTINLDETTKWPSVAVYNSGDDQVAFILVDTTGLEWIQFVIYKAAGASGEAGNITVYGRRY